MVPSCARGNFFDKLKEEARNIPIGRPLSDEHSSLLVHGYGWTYTSHKDKERWGKLYQNSKEVFTLEDQHYLFIDLGISTTPKVQKSDCL